jgi:hypothetical protein
MGWSRLWLRQVRLLWSNSDLGQRWKAPRGDPVSSVKLTTLTALTALTLITLVLLWAHIWFPVGKWIFLWHMACLESEACSWIKLAIQPGSWLDKTQQNTSLSIRVTADQFQFCEWQQQDNRHVRHAFSGGGLIPRRLFDPLWSGRKPECARTSSWPKAFVTRVNCLLVLTSQWVLS